MASSLAASQHGYSCLPLHGGAGGVGHSFSSKGRVPTYGSKMLGHMSPAGGSGREGLCQDAWGQSFLPRGLRVRDGESKRPPYSRRRGLGRPFFHKWLKESRVPVLGHGTGSGALDWLFARARRSAIREDFDTDLIVRSYGERDRLSELLRALSDIGHAPTMLRSPTKAGGFRVFLLRLSRIREFETQRAAQRLFRLDGISHVAYRSGARLGGLLVAVPGQIGAELSIALPQGCLDGTGARRTWDRWS